jgi:predicted Zn-dependent peptidase
MLYDCHKAFYSPANMILSVAGDIDPEEVLAIAEAVCLTERRSVPLRDHGDPTGPKEAVQSKREMTVSMPSFCMAFPCSPVEPGAETMKRELVGELASEILGGESSPLYARLYSSGLIDASFSIGYESIKDLCLLSMGGDSDDPRAVYEAILEEGQRIVREGIDEAWFQRLLHSSYGRRLRDLDSFSNICYRICAYEFDGFPYFDFPQAYTDLHSEDVRLFLQNCICREGSALSTIYPKEEIHETSI